MLMVIYQGICALVIVLAAAAVVRSRSLGLQVTGAIVILPLLLRLFLVK